MKSILAQVANQRKRITPQNEAEFMILQMALRIGDPLLFHPYLQTAKASSLAHCIEVFRREGKLFIIN